MRLRALLLTSVLLPAAAPGLPAQELRELSTFRGHTIRVTCALPSPDGKRVAFGGFNAGGGELTLWDAATGKEVGPLPDWTGHVDALAFAPDGKRLAAAASEGGLDVVRVWDVDTRTLLRTFSLPQAGRTALAWNREGSRVGVAGSEETRLWDVASGGEGASFRRLVPASFPRSAAFDPDLATLAAANYEEIELWDTATGKVRALLSEHRGQVCKVAYTPDGKTVVAASYLSGRKAWECRGEVRLWDVARRRERAVFQDGLGFVSGMALSPDGKVLAVLTQVDVRTEADLQLLEVGTGRPHVVRARPACSFSSVSFTTDGRLLLTGNTAEGMRLWEVTLPKREGK